MSGLDKISIREGQRLMAEIRPRPVGSRRQQKGKLPLFARSLLACCLVVVVVVVSDHLGLAAESEQPKNILVLHSFSDRSLLDPLERLKSAIRSRLNSPVNFYVREIGARLLSGDKPENIPDVHGSAARPNVDWRQLRRWNIPESVLPPGTIVLYRHQTTWKRNQEYILAGGAVIILQALLIAGLLWQRARSKSATGALEKLGGLLIHAQEAERANIARELHDDFSQRLALQCIELAQLEKNLPESEIEERARAMKVLMGTREISADMRSLSHQLHSSRLELVGLVCALRGLCQETAKSSKIIVLFTEPEFPLNLTKDVELCLFRVAQEALANVVKHSQASSAQVELVCDANEVSLRVSDAGKGFEPNLKAADAGIGLISMRERLRLLGGSLSVRSEPARGTEILAQIPLSASPDQERGTTHSA